ncbi:MAG: hypothetical protein ACFBSF_03480 [Leptolyngbyaceae cyanobacterium]
MNNHNHSQSLTESQRLFLQKYPQLEPDEIALRMEIAWGFDYYQPALLLLRS